MEKFYKGILSKEEEDLQLEKVSQDIYKYKKAPPMVKTKRIHEEKKESKKKQQKIEE